VELHDCIKSWRVQYIGVGRPRGWRLLGGNPRAAALVTWLPRQPLWAGSNTHAGGGPTAPMTNTIIIL
jgi:hypothetical protein